MSKFFNNYKTTDYELFGKTFNLTNITLRYKFKQNLTKNIYNFYDYTLKDGERLDHLSDMYYGNSDYVWVIVLANDMIDPQFEIPRPYDEFRKYVINKYGSWENVVNGIHHYERIAIYKNENEKIADINPPIIIDKKIYDNVLNQNGEKLYEDLPVLFDKEKTEITNLDYETELNEKKRSIKLLDSSQLNMIIDLVESVFE